MAPRNNASTAYATLLFNEVGNFEFLGNPTGKYLLFRGFAAPVSPVPVSSRSPILQITSWPGVFIFKTTSAMFLSILVLALSVRPLQGFTLGFINGASEYFEPIGEGFEARCNSSGFVCDIAVAVDATEDCSTCVCRRFKDVRRLLELGVDGIAMRPCDAEESIGFIQEAWDAGVPVVTFDADSPNSTRVAYVGTDEGFMGRTMARLLRQLRPEGGTFSVIGDKEERTIPFEEEITSFNDRKDEAHWYRVDLGVDLYERVGEDYLNMMELYAPYNVTAFVSFRQTPMKHENWTRFVDENRFRGITYIGVDNADYQLEYLNRKYVDGLVGQLPYEIGTQTFDVLVEYLEKGRLDHDFYTTNVVAYNLIPLELPDLEIDENLIGGLKYVGYSCFGVVVVTAFACVVWTVYNQTHRLVKAAQPFFLFMIAGGVVLLSSALIPLSMEGDGDPKEMTESYKVGICMAVPWLSFSGLTITFAALFSKTWRVNRLFHAKVGHARIQVGVKDVLAPFAVLLTINIIVLVCWTVIDPLTYTRDFYDGTDYWNREFASYGACRADTSEAFLAPLAIVNLSVVAIACWQAFEARSIRSEFAEAKYIGLAMFSLFQAFLTGIPVIVVVRETPQAYYMALSLMIFLLSMVVLLLIFVPKMMMLRNYEGLSQIEQRKRMESSVHLSSRTNRRQGGSSFLSPRPNGTISTGFRFSNMIDVGISDQFGPVCSLPKLCPLTKIELVTDSSTFQADLIDCLSKGFMDFHKGKFNFGPMQILGASPMAPFVKIEGYDAQTCVKAGYFEDSPYFVVKVASRGYPLTNFGSFQLHSQKTGSMECILFDESLLTQLRTAAVGALAARTLGPKRIHRIGILGTGVQAKFQLMFLRNVTTCRDVLVWGRSHMGIETFLKDMRREGWTVEVTAQPNDLIKKCELVVTTTSSREAILSQEENANNVARLITCIGADAPGKQELAPELVGAADKLVADSVDQSILCGEFQHWAQSGGDKEKILSLGEILCARSSQPQEEETGLTIFDSTGVEVQDVVIAQLAFESMTQKSGQFQVSEGSCPSREFVVRQEGVRGVISNQAVNATTNEPSKVVSIATISTVSNQ